MEEKHLQHNATMEATTNHQHQSMPPRADGATEAYALIVSGWATMKASLIALTIDTSTGAIKKKIPVTSFGDDPDGESTREFLWDSQRTVLVLSSL
jgi:hypothetical protein